MTFYIPSDVKESAIRLNNDINGNPRYYFPRHMWPKMDDKTRRSAGLGLGVGCDRCERCRCGEREASGDEDVTGHEEPAVGRG